MFTNHVVRVRNEQQACRALHAMLGLHGRPPHIWTLLLLCANHTGTSQEPKPNFGTLQPDSAAVDHYVQLVLGSASCGASCVSVGPRYRSAVSAAAEPRLQQPWRQHGQRSAPPQCFRMLKTSPLRKQHTDLLNQLWPLLGARWHQACLAEALGNAETGKFARNSFMLE